RPASPSTKRSKPRAPPDKKTGSGAPSKAARSSRPRPGSRSSPAPIPCPRRPGKLLSPRREREAALAILEEVASRLPRDLREVYWNDPRRQAVRAACLVDFASAPTTHFGVPGEDRLGRVLEINRAIAGEHDLGRLLGKVTDHAIALLRAERGFIILPSGHRVRLPAQAL